jgi:hypothetical protein
MPEINDIISGDMSEPDVAQSGEESLEEVGEIKIKENKKLNVAFKDVSKVIAPVMGAMLSKYLETQIGPVLTMLKYFLLVVSSIELIKAFCDKGVVKGNVCSLVNFNVA